MDASPSTFRLSGFLLIAAVGLIHLAMTHHHTEEYATYLGWLFVANFAGSFVAAAGIYRGTMWGGLLGALVAGAAFALFLISRTAGLAEAHHLVGHWSPIGIFSLVVEALFVALFLAAVALRRW